LAGSDASSASRRFRRSVDALGEIFEFIEGFFAGAPVSPDCLHDVCFVVEELFMNQVKYAAGNPNSLLLELRRSDGRLAVSLTDFDADPFDVRSVPDPRIDLPIEERRPGGLGIYLSKKLVDGIDYEYVDRRSTTTFTKALR
jgi:serine/threonine-protein kinase RsbW